MGAKGFYVMRRRFSRHVKQIFVINYMAFQTEMDCSDMNACVLKISLVTVYTWRHVENAILPDLWQ